MSTYRYVDTILHSRRSGFKTGWPDAYLAFNNGNIEATLGALKHAGITSSATLAKGLRALSVAGFIAKTRQGGVAWG
ncbi:MAG TPA: hypothetical protein VF265_02890, partial [Nevskiaceae bacterium]